MSMGCLNLINTSKPGFQVSAPFPNWLPGYRTHPRASHLSVSFLCLL